MAQTGAQAESAQNPLSLSDLDISDDEPRVKDVRIGERLGMAQPLNIRETVEANRSELERYGDIFTRSVKNGRRGRPATEYHLNEAQTLLLCMLSRTERAADVRQEVIEVFMAWRRGTLPQTTDQRPIPDLTQCPPGTGAMVTQGGIVYFDASNTDVMDGESALVVSTRSPHHQAPFIAPVRVLRGQDGTAETGYAHLSPGGGQTSTWDAPVPCRILGRFLLEMPRPKAPSLPDIAARDTRIAELERREGQLLAIIERLSGSLVAPTTTAPAPPPAPQCQPQSRRAPKPHRLSEDMVATVCQLLDQGLNDSETAARAGVSRPSVRRIRAGTWPHRRSQLSE